LSAAAQGSGNSGGSGGSGGSNQPRPSRNPRPSDQFNSPVFLTGRLMTELNRPPDDPVTVELSCGMRTIQVIHTDLGGYFTFTIGGTNSNFQSNMDFSASNEGPQPLQQSLGRPLGQSANPLSGCELRIAHAGYMPITATVPTNTDMNRVEMGVLRLNRLGAGKAGVVSVTSMMVPKDAAREYDRAIKDLQEGKLALARPRLEKAVELYGRYAEAWNELGRVRLTEKNREKAREAFNMAITADAEFSVPYINLASMSVQDKQWKEAAEAAGKALTIDNQNPMSAFLFAIATYNLNDLDSAEKSALHANQLGEGKLAHVHSLLAEIYMVKEDFARAAEHARLYLQLAPTGPFAARMREGLSQIELAGVDTAAPAAPGEKSGG
jgi:Tfp pilus assembly protein PilF